MQTIRQRLHALLLLAALTISLAVPASAAGSLPFTDVDPSEWYYTYVQDLYDAGIVDGVTSTAFRPEGTVTFGQALKLVLMAAGYENQAPTGTQTDHGEVHASVLHSGPIDLPLVAGDVDADPVIIVIAVVGEEPVFIHLEEGGIIGPFWHFFHHIDLFVAEVEVIPLLLGCVGVLW